MALQLSLTKPTPKLAKEILNILLYLSGAFALLESNFDIPDEVAAQINKILLASLALIRFTINFFHWDVDKPGTDKPKVYGVGGILILSTVLLFSCTTTKQAQVSAEISKYTQQAIDIAAKIEKVANNPRLEAVTIFTPADWDNKTIVQVRGYISSALPYIAIAQNCKDAELELLLKCIAVELQDLPHKQQRIIINKIVLLLALAQQVGKV